MNKVLEKLLRSDAKAPEGKATEAKATEAAFSSKIVKKKKGRPLVSKEKKARNFTLCLPVSHLEFLDKMVVKDPRVRGRGRKIRFIMERFLEHEKRSIGQMRVLKESLRQVQATLSGSSFLATREEMKKNIKSKRFELSPREKEKINQAVDNVHLLLQVLHYSPESLRRSLSGEFWSLLSFCIDWRTEKRRVVL